MEDHPAQTHNYLIEKHLFCKISEYVEKTFTATAMAIDSSAEQTIICVQTWLEYQLYSRKKFERKSKKL